MPPRTEAAAAGRAPKDRRCWGLLRRRGHCIQSVRLPQQLLEDVAGRQRRRRDESRDHAHHDGANFVVRNMGVAETLKDRLAQSLGRRRRRVDRKPDQAGIDHGSDARCPGKSELAGCGFAERIGEQHCRYRHRPFGESVGVVDIKPEEFGAGFGRHPGDEILHDIDAPLRRIDQRIGDLARALDQPFRVLFADQAANKVMLTLLLDTFETKDKRRRTAAELLHLRAVGHLEDLMLRQHVAHVGVAGDDDQPAELRDRPACPEESERDPQRPQPKPSENQRPGPIGAKVVKIKCIFIGCSLVHGYCPGCVNPVFQRPPGK